MKSNIKLRLSAGGLHPLEAHNKSAAAMVSKTQGLGPRRPGTSGLWAGVPGSGVPVAQDRAPRAQRDSESLGLGGHRPGGSPGAQKDTKQNTSTTNRTQTTPRDGNAGIMNFATSWEWEVASLCTPGSLTIMTKSRNSKLCYCTTCSCPCTQRAFLFSFFELCHL